MADLNQPVPKKSRRLRPPSVAGGNFRSPELQIRRPRYHGVRFRAGKWVSEITEPGKMKRIWLGTFHSPEMAAAAHDVAAVALRGRDAVLNFNNISEPFKVPASTLPADIRAAAMEAAMRFQQADHDVSSAISQLITPSLSTVLNVSGSSITVSEDGVEFPELGGISTQEFREFMDDELLFDVPNLLMDMAEGMLLSPPRMGLLSRENSPEISHNENLWSYQ